MPIEKYSDEDLIELSNSDIGEELRRRNYEYGWYKKEQYAGVIYVLVNKAFQNLVKIGYTDKCIGNQPTISTCS